MPCPFTCPKMFWAGPNFLCQTKDKALGKGRFLKRNQTHMGEGCIEMNFLYVLKW